MVKVTGRHKSIPKELKKTLFVYLPDNAKVIMNDICSCRHSYSPGYLRIINDYELCCKIRGYYGSGIVNFFVKFYSLETKDIFLSKIRKKYQ